MSAKSARRWIAATAATAAVSLYVLAARGMAVGAAEDDALQLLLARALRRGAYAFPDGTPANDPLPGFAALLALASALVQPHWDLLKLIGLASAAAVIYLTWKLARRFLEGNWALAAAGLTALSPLMLIHAGLILPDLPYLALSLLLFDRLADAGFAASPAMIAAAAAACLLRPQGAVLVAALALALAAAKGARRAARFAVPALAPLALWTLRNRLLTGSGSGYLLNMRAEIAALAEPRNAVLHAGGLLAALGGDGLLSFGRSLPLGGLVAAGASALALAAAGAVRLVRKEDARAFAIASYASSLLALQAVWMPLEPRYVLPLLPLAWIMILSASAPYLRARRAPALLFALLAFPALRLDMALAAPGLRGPARFQPRTMTWLAENAAPGALIETLEPRTVELLSGRRADLPDFDAGERDGWLADALRRRVEYVHVVSTFAAGGFFTPGMRRVAELSGAWCRSTPYAAPVFHDDEEGTAVFRLSHPDPDRYLKAWAAFQDGAAALRRGERPAVVRARLDEATRLEPRLALAWALRSFVELDPARGRRLLEKAAALDPTSPLIRRALDGPPAPGQQARPSLLRSPL